MIIYTAESLEQPEEGSVINCDPNVPFKSSKCGACTSDCMAQPTTVAWGAYTSAALDG